MQPVTGFHVASGHSIALLSAMTSSSPFHLKKNNLRGVSLDNLLVALPLAVNEYLQARKANGPNQWIIPAREGLSLPKVTNQKYCAALQCLQRAQC